jgi:hypothetical protein
LTGLSSLPNYSKALDMILDLEEQPQEGMEEEEEEVPLVGLEDIEREAQLLYSLIHAR